MVKVSIIMPVYNSEKFLKKAVDSVLNQKFEDFELILVDDGSPDASGSICDEFAEKDSRVKVIHKKNGGICSARNAGLKIAKGEYVGFCDNDDLYLPDLIEDNYRLAKENDVDLMRYAKIKRLEKDDGRVWEIHAKIQDMFIEKKDFAKHYQNIRREDTIWTAFYRREIIEKYNRDDFKVVIDTANGATYQVAEKVFSKLKINYKIVNNTPNGININKDCGSTHLEMLQKYVVENGYDLGIAYDGDGDRCLLVDENGEVIDGDKILAIVSNYMKAKGTLKKDTLVATVMSNLGLDIYAKENNLTFKRTKVGDRYVLEEMKKGGYNLGGEQSGHIIFLDYNPTGDGILTSLMFISIMLEKAEKASKLEKIIKIYPQVLVGAKVSNDKKYDFDKDAVIRNTIEAVEKEFEGNGRVLIRASGTEPLVRVMIEGTDQEYITEKAKSIAELIEQRLS